MVTFLALCARPGHADLLPSAHAEPAAWAAAAAEKRKVEMAPDESFRRNVGKLNAVWQSCGQHKVGDCRRAARARLAVELMAALLAGFSVIGLWRVCRVSEYSWTVWKEAASLWRRLKSWTWRAVEEGRCAQLVSSAQL